MSALPIIPINVGVSALQILQKEFAILEIGGKHGLIMLNELDWRPDMKHAPGLRIYGGHDAKIVLRRRLETIGYAHKPSQIIEDYWNNPLTKIYKNVAFSPAPQPDDVLNLWIGPTIEPKQGQWPVLRQFFEEVLCSGDKSTYEYLVRFIAHMIQKPEEKPGVMVVLLGGEGIGKGTLEVILRKIYRATTLIASDIDSVIGRFNAVLERTYIVFLDEALFHGNLKATERLKSFVTSQFVQIEEKHQPERSIESFHRFFAASNAKHFAHIDADNRRMFYLRVSEKFKGDHEYWRNLYGAINSGEVEAMFFDLKRIDLTDFVIQQRPDSPELLSQKIESLPSFERFWFEALFNGQIYTPCTFSQELISHSWDYNQFWSTTNILRSFQRWSKSAQRFQIKTSKNICDILEKVCPKAEKIRRMESAKRSWGYNLPSIDVARKDFEAYLGGNSIKWPKLDD